MAGNPGRGTTNGLQGGSSRAGGYLLCLRQARKGGAGQIGPLLLGATPQTPLYILGASPPDPLRNPAGWYNLRLVILRRPLRGAYPCGRLVGVPEMGGGLCVSLREAIFIWKKGGTYTAS